MQSYTEIPLSELRQHASSFREALQTVCESPAFRTSPKSCKFLRHIVDRSLSGDTDELKERLIGMSLLGREATYDTGSDAGVRVRANDVRKRLAAYNAATEEVRLFTFELPAGSYVPRFFATSVLSLKTRGDEDELILGAPDPNEMQVPLTLQQLALPTVIAVFLCIVCLRWQIAREQPFTTFWQGVFQGHSATLYLPSAQSNLGHPLVIMSDVQAITPLLNLAGQFSSQLDLTGDPNAHKGNTLITIGPTTGTEAEVGLGPTDDTGTGRLAVVDTANGRRIYDRTASTAYPAWGGSAALLTISNHPVRTIHIDGTDEASIDALVRLLCERGTFPEGLADGLSDAATTQVVFPMQSGAQPIFFHKAGVTLARTEATP